MHMSPRTRLRAAGVRSYLLTCQVVRRVCMSDFRVVTRVWLVYVVQLNWDVKRKKCESRVPSVPCLGQGRTHSNSGALFEKRQ